MADRESKEANPLWRLSGIGATMASEILAGVLVGWGLDYLFGTSPWLLIFFSIAGVVLGMTGFLRAAVKAQRGDGEASGKSDDEAG